MKRLVHLALVLHILHGASRTVLAAASAWDVSFWGDSLTEGDRYPAPPVPPGALVTNFIPFVAPHVHGYPGQDSTVIASNMLASTEFAYTTVIWAARSNYAALSVVTNDIARMVSALTNSPQCIVCGVINAAHVDGFPDETNGSTALEQILELNRTLSNTYGPRYLELREPLIAAAGTNAQDQADVAAGLTPSSLRIDHVHLNLAGYTVVASNMAWALNKLAVVGMQRASGGLVLTWLTNASYTLQASPSVDGPYTNVPAASPFLVNSEDKTRFFRTARSSP
jgi:hypothetical protein